MQLSTQPDRRTIEVTGLPEEVIQALEALVVTWRQQAQPLAAPLPLWQAPYEVWSKALREWGESHPKRENLADDSRESIYGDDGR